MTDLGNQVQALAQPLAELLARFHVKHPIHQTICAELYDAVNAIRDREVSRLSGLLESTSLSEGNKQLIQSKINFYEGR